MTATLDTIRPAPTSAAPSPSETPSEVASSRSSASTMPETPPRRRRSGAEAEEPSASVEMTSVSVTQVLPDRPGDHPDQRMCPPRTERDVSRVRAGPAVR